MMSFFPQTVEYYYISIFQSFFINSNGELTKQIDHIYYYISEVTCVGTYTGYFLLFRTQQIEILRVFFFLLTILLVVYF